MERIEEYLETIFDIQKEGKVAKNKDIAERLKIKPSSVTEMLNKLREMGYIDYQPYRGATLTKKGYEVAEKIKKNYLILKRFFKDFLGINEEKADELSCTLEHVIDDNVLEKICWIVSGNCDICERCNVDVQSLQDVERGEFVVIISPVQIEKVGIKAGKVIKVKDGVIIINGIELNLDEQVKKFILVKPYKLQTTDFL